MDDKYITTAQAGKLLGITSVAVVRLIQRGTLASSRTGMQYLIKRSAVTELMQNPAYLARSRRKLTMAELEEAGQIVLGSSLATKEDRAEELGRFRAHALGSTPDQKKEVEPDPSGRLGQCTVADDVKVGG